MNPLHRLFGYARPYRGRFVVAFAAMMVYAAATAAVAVLIKPVIDRVFPFSDAATAFRHLASRDFVGKIVIGFQERV